MIVGRAIASRWNSKLTGCFMDPVARNLSGGAAAARELMRAPGTEPPDGRSGFVAFARESGVRHSEWIVAGNSIAETLRWLGARHDLAVLDRDMVPSSRLLQTIGEAVLSCQLPCLILPPRWEREIRFERIVVGCNGSIEAIRAIHAALPFLKVARQITLVDGSLPDAEKMRSPFDPCAYLSRHAITCQPRHVRASFATASEILLKEAESCAADLLVMGAYGYSRMHERVFGDSTQRVLQEAMLPLLMQH